MAISGRVEAKLTVPSGADVTLTPANYSSGQTVSLAAGSYFHTAAGGVSGGLATWQTALNAAVNGYARTAASTATMLGYGDFTSGAAWGFDIASGNDTGLFGGVTLTASGTPVYGNTGPASAGDKAISFDADTEYFSAGDVYDVTAADDLIVAWVGYHTAVPATACALVSKRTAAGSNHWMLWRDTSGNVVMRVSDNTQILNATVAAPLNAWYVGIGILDRGAGHVRVVVCPLSGSPSQSSAVGIGAFGDCSNANSLQIGAAASTTIGDVDFKCAGLWVSTGTSVANGMSAGLTTAAQNFANAINSSYSVALSDTDGRVTIANSFWDYSLTWTSTTLRDLLGFDADIASVQTATGASAAHGVWCPNAAMDVGESDPRRAPRVTDLRTTTSPTGIVKGLTGTDYYRHVNVRWPLVPEARTWEAAADYANGSWETFFADTQLGEHSWFDVCSPIQIYDHNGLRVGSDKDVAGWQITGISDINPRRVGAWTGLWRIEIPQIVSSG